MRGQIALGALGRIAYTRGGEDVRLKFSTSTRGSELHREIRLGSWGVRSNESKQSRCCEQHRPKCGKKANNGRGARDRVHHGRDVVLHGRGDRRGRAARDMDIAGRVRARGNGLFVWEWVD